MKNREFYKEEIIKMAKDSTLDTCEGFAKKYVFPYYGIEGCDQGYVNCDFCRILQEMWLDEEYKEPEVDWTKVEVDTPILVSNIEEIWSKRYFAKFKDNRVYAWSDGATSWSAKDSISWNCAKLAEKE